MENISNLKIKWFKREIEKLKDKGISKADIARKLDVLPQYINSLISGNRGLTDQFLDKFISAYEINQIDLYSYISNRPKEVETNCNNNINTILSSEESIIYKMYKEKDEENKSLLKEIGCLEERIRHLEAGNIREKTDAKNVSIKKRSSSKTDDVGSATAQ